ncbi:uncharacterized protein LOC107803555 isoform X2 [Nicotiana tabacum]|uniref:Uncharacterized protein LOC107803555 isoform X2 n=1 Tax=Nicotiana tabacum TaxID=4097 RepID=A0AC58TKC7_TOBAC
MMATLPVCSATASFSSHTQIPPIYDYEGLRSFSSCWKTYHMKCNVMDRVSNSFHLHGASFRGQSPNSMFVHNSTPSSSSDIIYQNEFLTNHFSDSRSLQFVDTSALPKFSLDPANLGSVTTRELASLNLDSSSLSDVKSYAMDVFENGQSYLNNSLDGTSSSVTSALRQAVDEVISKLTSQTGESAVTAMKEASGRVGVLAVDALRHIILIVEDSVSRFVVYAYGSVMEMLPPEIQDVLNVSLLTPLRQGYVALEGLERNLGMDPSDPIIPFVLFLGASTSFWAFYWVLTYGGYAGNLSPKSSFELLKGDRNALLIDIRSEDLRENEGIPDLRRAARSRYANITLPEVDGSLKKLFKSGRELDDYLLAAVIRNLKIVQDRSQVIVMDANGNRSKGIARSLRKLGIKRPYLVQGGFQSWVKEGLRIKELKPETALTILNEEAEAIFEEISPTPLQLVGYGVGLVAAAYALGEWEKTLQYIGVFGLCQTLYCRVSSYEDSEDFKQDMRQLLAPVRLGGQAMTWAVGKLETNRSRNGLPTSPSSTDVQSRVLQAAAKHESQPENEELQDPSPETVSSVSENVDLSEA